MATVPLGCFSRQSQLDKIGTLAENSQSLWSLHCMYGETEALEYYMLIKAQKHCYYCRIMSAQPESPFAPCSRTLRQSWKEAALHWILPEDPSDGPSAPLVPKTSM